LKQILVLGAGQSAPYLIHYLLEQAPIHDWFVTVGDLDLSLAQRRVGDQPRGKAVAIDANDPTALESLVARADLVVNMLTPAFQAPIAAACVRHGSHMINASYQSEAVAQMAHDAQRKGVLLLTEMGLDPGIDHMSAMALLTRLRGEGGVVKALYSYGSGVAAPDTPSNPFQYVITWNPRNVVMAADGGAQYMRRGKIKLVPWHHVFHHTWPVEVAGVGTMEAYPNRDSLVYREAFGLHQVETMVRGTLRFPGWGETWAQIVTLGLPNEMHHIPDLANRTYQEVVAMFLPIGAEGATIEARVARFLHISPTGQIMARLRWLGLFSEERIGCKGHTAAAMMVHLLKDKLRLTEEARDLVILRHELEVTYPGLDRADEHITSTMVEYGEIGGFTAMAKTVGLPAALATELVLTDKLALRGCHIPTHPAIYVPILQALGKRGVRFTEVRGSKE